MNCLLIVKDVSLAPLLVAVKNVLITFLLGLNNTIFFSASLSFALSTLSRDTTVELSSSKTIEPSARVTLSSRRTKSTCASASVTKSAVKSSSAFVGSSIKTCRKSAKDLVTTELIVRSTLLEFSTISSDSAESDAVIFSPATKEPTTFVRLTFVALVPSPNTNPVAPLVTPFT